MVACESISGSDKFDSRNDLGWDQSLRFEVQVWKICNVSFSVLQKEQGGLLVNLNVYVACNFPW